MLLKVVYERSFSFSGFLLEKKIGVNQPKRLENARILIANTSMDTDKIKVSGCGLVVKRYNRLPW